MIGEKIREKGEFLWLGNHPAVDFINTETVQDGKSLDLFQESTDVLQWLRDAGLTQAATAPKQLLEEAQTYRAALRGSVFRLSGGENLLAEQLAATNHYLDRPQLIRNGAKYELVVSRYFKTVADFLAPVAYAFAELLAKGELKRLRKCCNPECVLFFYDKSKNSQRAWCSLDLCGNKMRMAASRRRKLFLHRPD